MDRLIRSFVKQWFKLLKYTSIVVFYTQCIIGNLTAIRLFLTIPVMHLTRVNSISENNDPRIQTLLHNNLLKR